MQDVLDITVKPLSPACGAEISGVDLTKPLSKAQVDAILDKAKAFKERDDRVDIIDKHRDDYGTIGITACYIGYLLPMMVEIQWWDKALERESETAAS